MASRSIGRASTRVLKLLAFSTNSDGNTGWIGWARAHAYTLWRALSEARLVAE
jgi:hypothetical protein